MKNTNNTNNNLKNKQGVYAVWVGDFVYIGSGNLGDRISGNNSKLKRGVHANKKLQQAYNKIQDIKIEVLDLCKDKEEARSLENTWIKHFKRIDDVIVCNRYNAYVSKEYKRKLNENDVVEIKKMLDEGVKNKDIAEKFNVHTTMISRIKTKKRYSNI